MTQCRSTAEYQSVDLHVIDYCFDFKTLLIVGVFDDRSEAFAAAEKLRLHMMLLICQSRCKTSTPKAYQYLY